MSTTIHSASATVVETEETRETYAGPERREATRAERSAYLRARKLRRELMRWIGGGAIGVSVMFGCFWVGRVESSLSAGVKAHETLAVLVKTVSELATTVKEADDRERATLDRQNKERTEVLLELKELNNQVGLLRVESQGRVVSGGRRDP